MSLLGRIRLPRADAPAPAATAVPASSAVVELDDDELEQVVGGLERIYIPGLVVAD
jgi:hypothetical protein